MISRSQLRTPLLLFITVSAVMTFMYGAAQQILRQSANDPQIQLARDGAASFSTGAPAVTITRTATIDVSSSLAPFIVIYGLDHKVIASSGRIGEITPTPPSGVFDAAKQYGEDRVTWEPKPGVRIAAVIVHARSGYVLAGRNLTEVESREQRLAIFALVALFATILAIGVASAILR